MHIHVIHGRCQALGSSSTYDGKIRGIISVSSDQLELLESEPSVWPRDLTADCVRILAAGANRRAACDIATFSVQGELSHGLTVLPFIEAR